MQLRDSRVTSHDRIKPISPSVTRPIRSVKPWRFAALGGEAEVGVDHLDIALIPAQLDGALAQGVLQAGALLVGQDLVRGRLAHVDHGLAAEMVRAHVPEIIDHLPERLARSSAMARR